MYHMSQIFQIQSNPRIMQKKTSHFCFCSFISPKVFSYVSVQLLLQTLCNDLNASNSCCNSMALTHPSSPSSSSATPSVLHLLAANITTHRTKRLFSIVLSLKLHRETFGSEQAWNYGNKVCFQYIKRV